MDISNMFKTAENKMSAQIAKNSEIRKIDQRIEDMITRVIDFLGEENRFIVNGLSYGQPAFILSDVDKKELTNTLVAKIKEFPKKLDAELGKFFDGIKDTETEVPEKETDETTDQVAEIPTKLAITRSVFNY